MKRIFTFTVLLLSLVLILFISWPPETIILNDDTFVMAEINGKKIELEVAKSGEKKQIGLMNRKNDLENNKGMLFVYDQEMDLSFWMKNTFISLDIIFVDKNLQVIDIHPNTIPLNSDILYRSSKKAIYAVELSGGWAKFNSVKAGDYFKIIKKI